MTIEEYIRSNLQPTFTKHPPNTSIKSQWIQPESWTGTIMPCGPALDSVDVNWTYNPTDNEVIYSVQGLKLNEWGERLVKEVPKINLIHRSRGVAIAAKPLLVNEANRRLSKSSDLLPFFERNKIPSRVIENAFYTIIEQTLSHMKFDMNHVFKFITEHATSSLGSDGFQSYKWNSAQLEKSTWREFFSLSRDMIKEFADHPDYFIKTKVNYGLRARSESFNYFDYNDNNVNITRSRMVTFNVAWTMLVFWILDKRDWYSKILNSIIAPLGPSLEMKFVPAIGGQVYNQVGALLESGYTMLDYDASTWDANVPSVLTSTFNPFFFYLDKPQLPSGSGMTTLLGSSATGLAMSLKPLNFEVIVYNLGDDVIILVDPKNVKALKQYMATYKPFTELQPDDTEFKFMLGLSFKDDYTKPRILGFKLTKDQAKSRIPIKLNQDTQSIQLNNNLSNLERELWFGLYLGDFNGKSLLQSIAGVTDIISPTALQEKLIEDEIKKLTNNRNIEERASLENF